MNFCEMRNFSVGIDPNSLIANSIVAAVVTDPRQADNPIIACNDAFVRLTGYDYAEIIGRNCRFLRGTTTETAQTAMLKDAISLKRPIIVELINYRKDGSRFRNAVMIAPLSDEKGELAYFLGSQMAVEDLDASRHLLAQERIKKLSLRQQTILKSLANGRVNKQIAFDLGLTERTIKMHRAAMLRALGASTVAEAIRIAIEAGY